MTDDALPSFGTDDKDRLAERKLRAMRIVLNRNMLADGTLTHDEYGDNLALDLAEAGIDQDTEGDAVLLIDAVALVAVELAQMAAEATRQAMKNDDVHAGTLLVALLQSYSETPPPPAIS